MAGKYTKQTPSDVRVWLDGQSLVFPSDWNLNQVTEESRRRNLAGRWAGIEAARAVAHWSAYKLATSRDFTGAHWDWLVSPGAYSPHDLYGRLLLILEPAVGEGAGWRLTDAAKAKVLKEIGDKASELLSILEVEGRLDIGFPEVVGHKPELQPLLDRASEISEKRMREIQAWNRTDRAHPLPPAEFPHFVGGPRLTDYLVALLAKLLGEGKRAYPNLRSVLPDGLADDWADAPEDDEADGEIEPEELSKLLGFGTTGALDPALLRDRGAFGGAPARADSLLNAIVRSFPRPLFDRHLPPPKTPPASMIEAACLAWFGESPTQKEINAKIREERAQLEPAMQRAINGHAKLEALRATWKAEGLSEEEVRRREFQTFLGEE